MVRIRITGGEVGLIPTNRGLATQLAVWRYWGDFVYRLIIIVILMHFFVILIIIYK